MRKLVSAASLVAVSGGAVMAAAGIAQAGVNVGNNWCAAPWSWPGPASTNAAPFSYDTCNGQTNGTDVTGVGGTDVANNWCAAPWDWEGPLSMNVAPFPYRACDEQTNDAPARPVSLTIAPTTLTGTAAPTAPLAPAAPVGTDAQTAPTAQVGTSPCPPAFAGPAQSAVTAAPREAVRQAPVASSDALGGLSSLVGGLPGLGLPLGL